MAEIFNNFDRQTETRFLTALEEDNRESAERHQDFDVHV
jgi:flagellar motor switch protein FliG